VLIKVRQLNINKNVAFMAFIVFLAGAGAAAFNVAFIAFIVFLAGARAAAFGVAFIAFMTFMAMQKTRTCKTFGVLQT